MPAYCCALNCKSNGFSNPELSFFKFPLNRKDILDQWIKVLRRDSKWRPTIHSRLCSIHFSECSYFLKRGSRLRLLADAIPSIFDFRKITGNRKKADKNAINENLIETDCPDPNLYEMVTEKIVDIHKCGICCKSCDSSFDFDSTIERKLEKFSLKFIISELLDKDVNVTESTRFCGNCVKRLKSSFDLKLEMESTLKKDIDPLEILPKATSDELIIYCKSCSESFERTELAEHLKTCFMRNQADEEGIPAAIRRILVCHLCHELIYKHNSEKHFDECEKLSKSRKEMIKSQ